jgi:hypothetical protein
MAVSEVEKYLQQQCKGLRENCRDKEEAKTFLPEIVKLAQRIFFRDYYEIPGYAEDIFEETFENDDKTE